MPTVVANIERRIALLGLKKKFVAKEAGYTEQQFSNMLNGRKVIRPEDISTLAKVLKCTPNDLFNEERSKA